MANTMRAVRKVEARVGLTVDEVPVPGGVDMEGVVVSVLGVEPGLGVDREEVVVSVLGGKWIAGEVEVQG